MCMRTRVCAYMKTFICFHTFSTLLANLLVYIFYFLCKYISAISSACFTLKNTRPSGYVCLFHYSRTHELKTHITATNKTTASIVTASPKRYVFFHIPPVRQPAAAFQRTSGSDTCLPSTAAPYCTFLGQTGSYAGEGGWWLSLCCSISPSRKMFLFVSRSGD